MSVCPVFRAAVVATAILAGFSGLSLVQAAGEARTASAIFASGCFWSTERDFEMLPGVISVESGYTAGKTANPTYAEVSSGATGYAEAARVVYDPARVSYAQLLDHFWRNVDPTVKNRQFCDIGSQYRSAIYWQSEVERKAAEESRDALLRSGRFKEIHTEIAAATTFYPAEGEHQDFYKKHAAQYESYRLGCRRDARLRELWGKK